jgi:hypothetical protein
MDEEGKMREPQERFLSIPQGDVPKGRDGKHKHIILQLMDSLEHLSQGAALKIPIADLPDTKENIRAALSRVTKQRNMDVATSSDDKYLYVWKVDQ